MSIFNFQQRLWNWCENDLKSLLAFILSLVFCGCAPPHTATPPLFPAFSPSQRNVWYSRDCLLFFSLQSTLLLFSPPYSFQLSSLASWCLFFLPFFKCIQAIFKIVFSTHWLCHGIRIHSFMGDKHGSRSHVPLPYTFCPVSFKNHKIKLYLNAEA